MSKIRTAEHGTVFMAVRDVQNPNADRRCRGDWTREAVINQGSRFQVIIAPRGRRTLIKSESKFHRLYVYDKPIDQSDDSLIAALDVACEQVEPTGSERLSAIGIEHGLDTRGVLATLLESGAVTEDQIAMIWNAE